MREDLLFQILPYSRSHAVSEKSAILTDTCDFKENQHFSVRMVAELERKNAEFVTRKSTFTDVEVFECRAEPPPTIYRKKSPLWNLTLKMAKRWCTRGFGSCVSIISDFSKLILGILMMNFGTCLFENLRDFIPCPRLYFGCGFCVSGKYKSVLPWVPSNCSK